MRDLFFAISLKGVFVENWNNQIFNFIHHARLKNILQELIVSRGASRLNFNNNFMVSTKCICGKKNVNPIIFTEKNWNMYLSA